MKINKQKTDIDSTGIIITLNMNEPHYSKCQDYYTGIKKALFIYTHTHTVYKRKSLDSKTQMDGKIILREFHSSTLYVSKSWNSKKKIRNITRNKKEHFIITEGSPGRYNNNKFDTHQKSHFTCSKTQQNYKEK